MPSPPRWDSSQYLRFEHERSRPCHDLVGRVDLATPRRIVDLGCGPGTSTALLRRRWREADVMGVDSSAEMLEAARRSDPTGRWVEGDLRTAIPDGEWDLVFSNAALHWIPDHRAEVPRLWRRVADGGALAFQVPARGERLPGWVEALSTLRGRPRWSRSFPSVVDDYHVLPLEAYYELLGTEARQVDLWDTEYQHVLAGPEAIVQWVMGAGLRPWLQPLASDAEREEFLEEYSVEVARRYPSPAGGPVLFPFLRRFVIAYR